MTTTHALDAPCPWCWDTNARPCEELYCSREDRHAVICGTCKARGPQCLTRDDAISEWARATSMFRVDAVGAVGAVEAGNKSVSYRAIDGPPRCITIYHDHDGNIVDVT